MSNTNGHRGPRDGPVSQWGTHNSAPNRRDLAHRRNPVIIDSCSSTGLCRVVWYNVSCSGLELLAFHLIAVKGPADSEQETMAMLLLRKPYHAYHTALRFGIGLLGVRPCDNRPESCTTAGSGLFAPLTYHYQQIWVRRQSPFRAPDSLNQKKKKMSVRCATL